MSIPVYAARDEVVLAAPPERVWAALVAELGGASAWWLPNNTFVPLSASVDAVGSSVRVEVRPNGRDANGPVLAFVATTRMVVAEQLLVMDFVDGCFSGGWRFELAPLGGGLATRLVLTFEAEPRGWVRQLARLVDVGAQHTVGARVAFEKLAAVLGAGAGAVAGAGAGAGPGAGVGRTARVVDAAADARRPAPVRTVSTVRAADGAALHVRRDSPARSTPGPASGTAMLLHGWASDASAWDAVTEILVRSGVTVVRPELRGHAGSAGARVPHPSALLDLLAADALAVVDQLGERVAGPLVVVGHSGGGLVALDVADARPAVVSGVVLVSSSAKQAVMPAAERSVVASRWLGRVLRTGRGAEAVLSRTMGPARAFDGRRAVAAAFAATAPAVRRAFFDASSGADRQEVLSNLATTHLPIAVISGVDDLTIPIADVRATARTAGLVGPVEASGRGHALPVEAPDAVAAEILSVIGARRAEAVPVS